MREPETETDPTAPTADEDIAIRAPANSPNDEPISIRITGAAAGATVEFEATLVDDDGVEWRSRATFTADDAGVVDLTETAPDDGRGEHRSRAHGRPGCS